MTERRLDDHADGPPALAMDAVDLRYGRGANTVHALSGVSLAVHRGEFVAVMGPSGSGKSSLVHVAAGLVTPTSGTISVQGRDHTVGSSIVTTYSTVSADTRVSFSTRCRPSVDPRKLAFGEKFLVSTISVSPSQRARESPWYIVMAFDRAGPAWVGKMRVSWFISVRSATTSGPCVIAK